MKILIENKEDLPVSFLTDFISDGWEKVGYLQSDIDNIGKDFKDTKEITKIIQNLIDAYVVCIGQLEGIIGDKNYIKGIKTDIKENMAQANPGTPNTTANKSATASNKPEQNAQNQAQNTQSSSADKIPAKANTAQPGATNAATIKPADKQQGAAQAIDEDFELEELDDTDFEIGSGDDYGFDDEFPAPLKLTDNDLENYYPGLYK